MLRGDWAVYRQEHARYEVQYPASWTVEEVIESDGFLTTSFIPPGDGCAITVTAGEGVPAFLGDDDIPHGKRRHISINGLDGEQFFDSISLSISTVLLGKDRWYDIATWGRGSSAGVFDHLLESFRPIE